MKTIVIQRLVPFLGFCALWALSACTAPDVQPVDKAVRSFEVLKNGDPIPENSNGNPEFSIIEEKSAVLGAKLFPDVRAGIHWQSSRGIVDLSDFSGPEIILFARYGGETNITVRAANIVNEAPVFQTVRVTVLPTSYYKWDYRLDGWKDMPPSTPYTVDRIYNRVLMLSGDTPVNEDAGRGGFVLEGPGMLVIGSVMPTVTNSVYDEDPPMDGSAQFNFSRAPSITIIKSGGNTIVEDQGLYTGKIRISADYEILEPPARRQGLRIQVNNNTVERDNASVLTNWLVAEYSADTHRPSGTLTGIFNTVPASEGGVLALDPRIADRISETPRWPDVFTNGVPSPDNDDDPADKEARQLLTVLTSSFVCLALPDGKALIRSIRIERAD